MLLPSPSVRRKSFFVCSKIATQNWFCIAMPKFCIALLYSILFACVISHNIKTKSVLFLLRLTFIILLLSNVSIVECIDQTFRHVDTNCVYRYTTTLLTFRIRQPYLFTSHFCHADFCWMWANIVQMFAFLCVNKPKVPQKDYKSL